MIPRNTQESETQFSAEDARKNLLEKDYSWRRAADALGYSHSHFFKVLSGIHSSNTLITAVMQLKKSSVPYRTGGFASKKKGAK